MTAAVPSCPVCWDLGPAYFLQRGDLDRLRVACCASCAGAFSRYVQQFGEAPQSTLDWYFYASHGRTLAQDLVTKIWQGKHELGPADLVRQGERVDHAHRAYNHARARAEERLGLMLTPTIYEDWCSLASSSQRRGPPRQDGTQVVVIEYNGALRVGWNYDLGRVTTVLGPGDWHHPDDEDFDVNPHIDAAAYRAALDRLDDDTGRRILAGDWATMPPTLDASRPDGVRSLHGSPEDPTIRQEATMTTPTPALAASPFKKATLIPKRLKAFIWGASGTGKTTLALAFPSPVVIDLERGTDYYGDKFNFERLDPTPRTVEEMFAAVRWLLENDHEFRTLIIDPITVFWEMMQNEWQDRLGAKAVKKRAIEDAEEFDLQPKDWKPIKAQFREFMRMLTAVDMNVIVTAREKTKYADGQFMKAIGETFDGEKSMPYLFDVELRIFRRQDGQRLVHVMKDRTGTMPKVDFPLGYSEFEKCLGKDALVKKADKVQLEGPAPVASEVAALGAGLKAPAGPPASDAQITALTRLVKAKLDQDLPTFLVHSGFADGEGKLIMPNWTEAASLIEQVQKEPARAGAGA